MKNLIFAILFLSALTAYFSFYGEIVPSSRTGEGWAFFGGDSGDPIPGNGENGEVDVFSINSPHETTQTQQKSPISVTVVYPDQEHAEEYRQAIRETFLIGVAVGALLAELVTAGVFGILYLREKAHGHQTGKA